MTRKAPWRCCARCYRRAEITRGAVPEGWATWMVANNTGAIRMVDLCESCSAVVLEVLDLNCANVHKKETFNQSTEAAR